MMTGRSIEDGGRMQRAARGTEAGLRGGNPRDFFGGRSLATSGLAQRLALHVLTLKTKRHNTMH